MRILLLSNKSPWPPHDGGASATWSLINSLKENKVQVTLLSLNTSKHYLDPHDIPAGFDYKTDFHLIPVNTGVNPVKLLINLLFSRKPYSLQRFKSEIFSRELSVLLKEPYDIIQAEGLAMAEYLPLARKLSQAKLIYRPHNIESLIWIQLADEEKNFLRRYYFRVLASRTRETELNLTGDIDALITFTSPDLDWFRSAGYSKPFLLNPPGINIEKTLPAISNAGPVFFIGALDWRPNINGLTWFIKKVWPLIIHKFPDASFHVAGRNAGGKVAKLIKGPNVVCHGEVSSSHEFITDKGIMIVPLFSGSGIRMKILEGMSMGKCIVSTHLAVKGIECEDKKNIFLADDAETFADAVLRLIADEDLRRKTGENALENVRKNYNNLAATEKLLKFFSDLT